MKTIYMVMVSKGYDEFMVEMFDTREQAELFCDTYGYYKDGIETHSVYEKGDKFKTSDIWWRVNGVRVSAVLNYNNQIQWDDITLLEPESEFTAEDLKIIDGLFDEKILYFNVKANSKQEAIIRANERVLE